MLCPAVHVHTNHLPHRPHHSVRSFSMQVVERAVADLAAKYNKNPKDPVVGTFLYLCAEVPLTCC